MDGVSASGRPGREEGKSGTGGVPSPGGSRGIDTLTYAVRVVGGASPPGSDELRSPGCLMRSTPSVSARSVRWGAGRGRYRRAEYFRARYPDDPEDVPLRRGREHERHPGSPPAEGDHQRFEGGFPARQAVGPGGVPGTQGMRPLVCVSRGEGVERKASRSSARGGGSESGTRLPHPTKIPLMLQGFCMAGGRHYPAGPSPRTEGPFRGFESFSADQERSRGGGVLVGVFGTEAQAPFQREVLCFILLGGLGVCRHLPRPSRPIGRGPPKRSQIPSRTPFLFLVFSSVFRSACSPLKATRT